MGSATPRSAPPPWNAGMPTGAEAAAVLAGAGATAWEVVAIGAGARVERRFQMTATAAAARIRGIQSFIRALGERFSLWGVGCGGGLWCDKSHPTGYFADTS